jgi:hypothetical protein
MNFGINHNLDLGSDSYHIQIEDHEKNKELEVRVYVEGQIIFQKLQSYEMAIMGLENPKHIEVAVKEELQKLFYLTKAAIERGKIKK